MKKVYIAHPYSSGDPKQNYERYLRCCAAAMKAGVCVISWAHNVETENRKLTGPSEDPKWYKWYMAQDKTLLSLADELWVIVPWKHSTGINIEIEKAKELGKLVRFLEFDEERELLSLAEG